MATYDSRHTGEELDQAVDLLLDYRGAIDAGIKEIEDSAPELYARMDALEEDNERRSFSSSAVINAIIAEAYLAGTHTGTISATKVTIMRATWNAAREKYQNRIILGDSSVAGGSIDAYVDYATEAAALAAFTTPLQKMTCQEGTLVVCIYPEAWADIEAMVQATCTFKDPTQRGNAPTCVAALAMEVAETDRPRVAAMEQQLHGLSFLDCTEAQYDAWVAAGTINPNTVYLVE